MAHLEAVAGLGVTVDARFTDADNAPVNATAPELIVYDQHRRVILRRAVTAEEHTGTGVYTVRYVPPESLLQWWEEEVDISLLVRGAVEGVERVGARHRVTVTWAD
jgi:hypothetical protein